VQDDVWPVTAEGEHDLSVSPSVGDALDALERRVGTKIVVDPTPAEFIDSTIVKPFQARRPARPACGCRPIGLVRGAYSSC